LLAEGGDFPNQAIRFGNAFGLQFHPDVTTAMMYRWTTCGGDRLDMPGAYPREQHFAGRARYDVAERAWLKHFLDGWLARAMDVALAEAAE
jgi:GMP synthase (glutamine-hydrolysing)